MIHHFTIYCLSMNLGNHKKLPPTLAEETCVITRKKKEKCLCFNKQKKTLSQS